MARPIKATYDGLRAIDAWFRHHGDPFVPLEALKFVAEVDRHQDAFDKVTDTLTNAELIARLWSTFAALNVRLKLAARTED